MSDQKIGRYEIDHELGRGGMAVVYLARDPLMKRQVAIKVLPRQFTFEPHFRTRFQREAEVIAALEHPAIVPVYDFGEYEEQPFIVMRYMPGGSLLDRMERGPLALAETAHLVGRVAEALDEAHARHIVHRDLKPGNILFDTRGEAFLSDFGIAKMTEGTSTVASTGIMGTPAYMSPEQARGVKELDARSDVYSLGVILFQLLTGELPFKADTPMGMAVAHITEPVPSALSVKPDLPPQSEELLGHALSKSPAERYQTASALARDLSQLAGGGKMPTLPAGIPPVVSHPVTPSSPAADQPSTPPPTFVPSAPETELPLSLRQAIENPIPEVREGAVRTLETLLTGSQPGLAATAMAALQRLAESDDSRRVSQAAAKALADYTAMQRAKERAREDREEKENAARAEAERQRQIAKAQQAEELRAEAMRVEAHPVTAPAVEQPRPVRAATGPMVAQPQREGYSLVFWWTAASAAGWTIGAVVSSVIGGLGVGLVSALSPGLSRGGMATAVVLALIGIATGAGAGAAIGAMQWLVLRRRIQRAGCWVLASAGGFAAAGAIIGFAVGVAA
jgi:serine/threonine protein kinase